MGTNTVVYDVIGTLFSLESVRNRMIKFGAPHYALDLWFAEALRDYFAASYADAYTPFSSVLGAAMERTFALLDLKLTEDEKVTVMQSLGAMRLHAEAASAFEAFERAGWKQLTLTNGSEDFTRALLTQAGVDRFFAGILSCDAVGRSKPHKDVYELARRNADGEIWMIAAHAWDIQGAARAGLRTAYITSKEKVYLNAYPAPEIVASDLATAAAAILE
jgi:2-haloacid dehalogenase